MAKKIGVLVGSLRKGSYSRAVAKALMSTFEDGYEAEIIELGDLPIYNQDFEIENKVPESYTTFRNKLDEMDGFVFVTPEYNRSVPALMKNAIDVGSRPYGESKWDGKPGLIVSVSPSDMGGFGANHHLRQSFVFLNIDVIQQPEAYVRNVAEFIDDDGKITDESMLNRLASYAKALTDRIALHDLAK